MKRKTGYLANLISIPPLVFRFQFNPELLSEKKGFEYHETESIGDWALKQYKEAKGTAEISAAFEVAKEVGAVLTGTKGQQMVGGKPRTFALEFALDARGLPDVEGDEMSLEPAMAVLRSFLIPAYDPIGDVIAIIAKKKVQAPARPPACNLKLGALDLECVVNDLNLKTTHFNPDLTAQRVEVSMTLTEQTHSLATTIDYLGRLVDLARYEAKLDGEDFLQNVPGASAVRNVIEEF